MEEALVEEVKLTLGKKEKKIKMWKQYNLPSLLPYPLVYAGIKYHLVTAIILFQVMPFYMMLVQQNSFSHCLI